MKLPGTKMLDVNSIIPVASTNELFCFHISPYDAPNYMDKFFAEINDLLPEFCFSATSLKNHQRLFDEGKTKRTPLKIAREFLQQTVEGRSFDSGEFAEFLLYLFAKKVKGAHKLVTKVHARGSTRMTTPGRDNSFAYKSNDGKIYMLLGEAKSKPDANDALREGQSDINAFWKTSDVKHEINLASTHIRTEMNAENADLFECYFIEDHELRKKLHFKNIIFVTYSFDTFKNLVAGSATNLQFEKALQTDLERCFENQKALISASPYSTIYCFMPFECINAARDMFASTNSLIYTK